MIILEKRKVSNQWLVYTLKNRHSMKYKISRIKIYRVENNEIANKMYWKAIILNACSLISLITLINFLPNLSGK